MPSQQWNTKKVIYLSMLVALQIILSRVFSINAWNIRIGFGFIPMIFAILYFGTKEGVLVAFLSLFSGLYSVPRSFCLPFFAGNSKKENERNDSFRRSSYTADLQSLLKQFMDCNQFRLSSSPYHAYSFDSDFHQWKYAILYDSIYGVYSGKSSFFAGV